MTVLVSAPLLKSLQAGEGGLGGGRVAFDNLKMQMIFSMAISNAIDIYGKFPINENGPPQRKNK